MAKSNKRNTEKKRVDPVKFRISKISLVKQFVDHPTHLNYDETGNYGYLFEVDINLLEDKSIVQVIISYKFYFKEHELLNMKVENDFNIENFNKVVINEEIVDKIFLVFLVNISINHTRGIQSIITKETPYRNYYIPPLTRDRILAKIKKKAATQKTETK